MLNIFPLSGKVNQESLLELLNDHIKTAARQGIVVTTVGDPEGLCFFYSAGPRAVLPGRTNV